MAKTNPEAPMIKQGKWKYTWHMMKTNKACYAMLLPFMSLFIIFTVVPVVMSLPMGFTNFNMIETPKFVGLSNFYTLFLNDDVFLIAVRNTLIFAIFTGPFSYILSFIIAWLINEMNAFLKTFFTFVFYAPSMTTSVYVTWQLILSGDSYGYLNAVLIDLGILNEPAQWLTDTNYILTVVIICLLYTSDAADIQISASFTVGVVGQNLVGLPSTDYAAHTIMNHATDYGNIRYEMGYASAICFVLFAAMLLANKGINWLLGKYLD